MKTNPSAILLSLVLCAAPPAAETPSTNQASSTNWTPDVSALLPDLRRTGVLEDMRKYGLVTNQDSQITWPELWAAMWRLKTDHLPLGVEPAAWKRIPPPDLRGPNDPGGVEVFIRANGWKMGRGIAGAAWGLVKTKPISGLPWNDIKHREFQAVTANGILYVILDGFHHSMYGVAYNPCTNRFDAGLAGFSSIGEHWYAWRQPEDPMKLTQRYEGGDTGQPAGPANGSHPFII
jgi:hypothetical protein